MHLNNMMKVSPRTIKRDYSPGSVRCEAKIVCLRHFIDTYLYTVL